MALDFITANVYVVSEKGFILACDGTPTFTCVTVLSNESGPNGIALNPNDG